MSLTLDEMARALGEADRYCQRAGLAAGPLPGVLLDLWACHGELVAEEALATSLLEEKESEIRELTATTAEEAN